MTSELSCIDTEAVAVARVRPASPNRIAEPAVRIGRTMAFMRDNLDKPVQAATLAAHASMSLSHYFALFRQVTGHTPIDYFIQLRMGRARQLLTSTDLSVKEVAAALGYEDAFYFSRAFKAVNGVAPTEYRSGLRTDSSVDRKLARTQTGGDKQ